MNIVKTAIKGVTYFDPRKADDGYTLFSPLGNTDTWLIDMEGRVVKHWKFQSLPEGHTVLLPNGHLLRTQRIKLPEEWGLPKEAAGVGGDLVEVDWDGEVVWRTEAPYQTHDFFPLENGNVLYCDTHPEGILPEELMRRWKGGLAGTEHHGKLFGDGICEINRQNEIVWKWRPADHLDPEVDTICPRCPRNHLHANAIFKCKDGNLIFSCRSLDEVLRIEYPSGRVIGRYGKGELAHQHDCRELENGNILVFDNGLHRRSSEPNYSRSVELDHRTGEVVWQYKADPPYSFYSAVCGGSERLPNGNTLICETLSARLFEVTMDGEIVWEYVSPFMGQRLLDTGLRIASPFMFRAHRYPRDYPGFKGKDLDPKNYPWENALYGPDAFRTEFKPIIF